MGFIKDLIKVGVGSAVGGSIAGKQIGKSLGKGFEKGQLKAQGFQSGKITDGMGLYNNLIKIDIGTLMLDGDKLLFSASKKFGVISTGKHYYVEINLNDVTSVLIEGLLPKKLVVTLKNGTIYNFTNRVEPINRDCIYSLEEWQLYLNKAISNLNGEKQKELPQRTIKKGNDKFCISCGEKLPKEAKFCAGCGKKQ